MKKYPVATDHALNPQVRNTQQEPTVHMHECTLVTLDGQITQEMNIILYRITHSTDKSGSYLVARLCSRLSMGTWMLAFKDDLLIILMSLAGQQSGCYQEVFLSDCLWEVQNDLQV